MSKDITNTQAVVILGVVVFFAFFFCGLMDATGIGAPWCERVTHRINF